MDINAIAYIEKENRFFIPEVISNINNVMYAKEKNGWDKKVGKEVKLYDKVNISTLGVKDNFYVDSTIFEFKHLVNRIKIPLVGYFKWDKNEGRYIIIVLMNPDTTTYNYIYYDSEKFSDFKIIDTVQENKKGLV